jgi:hypothetical protein
MIAGAVCGCEDPVSKNSTASKRSEASRVKVQTMAPAWTLTETFTASDLDEIASGVTDSRSAYIRFGSRQETGKSVAFLLVDDIGETSMAAVTRCLEMVKQLKQIAAGTLVIQSNGGPRVGKKPSGGGQVNYINPNDGFECSLRL